MVVVDCVHDSWTRDPSSNPALNDNMIKKY